MHQIKRHIINLIFLSTNLLIDERFSQNSNPVKAAKQIICYLMNEIKHIWSLYYCRLKNKLKSLN